MAQTLDKQNLASAAVAVVLGIAITVQGMSYPIGGLTQMGPGFFPTAIGVLITILGIVLAIGTLWRPGAEPIEVDWRPLVMIPLALIVFAVSLERLGLAPATLLLVAVATLAQPGFRPRLILGVTLFMIVTTGLIFVYGLNMPVDLVRGLSL